MFSIIKIWYTNNNDRKGGDRMKETAGEANMTVITIVLIGIVLAIGTPLITNILQSTEKSGCCQANGGVWKGGKCYATCNQQGSCSGTVNTTCQ